MSTRSIGERIKAIRIEMGLSQKQFGDRLLITCTTIHHYEHGHTIPDLYNLIKIAEVGNRSLDWIVFGT